MCSYDARLKGFFLLELYVIEGVYLYDAFFYKMFRRKLKKELKLTSDESELVDELFPRTITFPVEVSKLPRERLEQYLRQKKAIRGYELKREIAQSFEPYRDICDAAVKALLELDYAFMLGKFAWKYQCVLPNLSNRVGVGFENGYSLRLLSLSNGDRSYIEPVSYSFGDIDAKPTSLGTERIILLSGANSGGKTTLIQNIAFSVILGHMGLGVPAKACEIGLMDELHFFEKSTGQADAGAFESTLNLLASMLHGLGKKLVLADEMESISEPGASARVISAFLDMLSQQSNSCGVFVTHLAPEIQKESKKHLRIDGIEAEGLNDKLQLIVNRSPSYYKYARSTPQLIVERMYRASTENEAKEIFGEVLSRFTSEMMKSEDLAITTQLEAFSENFKEISSVYKDISSGDVGLEANAEQILSLYVTLMEQVYSASLHIKILVLLHGEKEEWTRKEVTDSLGFQPSAVSKALGELNRAGLVRYDQEDDKISLIQRLYH